MPKRVTAALCAKTDSVQVFREVAPLWLVLKRRPKSNRPTGSYTSCYQKGFSTFWESTHPEWCDHEAPTRGKTFSPRRWLQGTCHLDCCLVYSQAVGWHVLVVKCIGTTKLPTTWIRLTLVKTCVLFSTMVSHEPAYQRKNQTEPLKRGQFTMLILQEKVIQTPYCTQQWTSSYFSLQI